MKRNRRQPVPIDRLESRVLMSAALTNVNISQRTGNQAEGAITVDPAHPAHLFSVSNIDVGDGLFVGTSSDGGATWSGRLIADGSDELPRACCDPSAAFDSYGNLFLTYLNSSDNRIEVLLSTDAGQSFVLLKQFSGDVDQPTITTGPGSVWLTSDHGDGVATAGANVAGLGDVGSFAALQLVRGSTGGAFGDIAVGPGGQVMVTYQKGGRGSSKVYVSVDPDGLGAQPFGKPVAVTTTHVGDFDYIPAQSSRGIDAEPGLAFDRSSGPFAGRVYLVYTDERPARSGNTDIFLRYSDDQGASWSNPIRVNDDTGSNSQFLPRISLDQTTGDAAVSWYDARNDLGNGGAGDTDGVANDDVQFYAATVTPQAEGVIVSVNQQISAGTSNAADANNSIDLGDYTGLAFYNGVVHPLWFDNSNSTGDNAGGALRSLDVYTAAANASDFAAGPRVSLGGLAVSSGATAGLWYRGGANTSLVRGRQAYTITVALSDSYGINQSTLADGNLLVTGPDGMTVPVRFRRIRLQAHGTRTLAIYSVAAPDGRWRSADGAYTIALLPNQIGDGAGQFCEGGILGSFVAVS